MVGNLFPDTIAIFEDIRSHINHLYLSFMEKNEMLQVDIIATLGRSFTEVILHSGAVIVFLSLINMQQWLTQVHYLHV